MRIRLSTHRRDGSHYTCKQKTGNNINIHSNSATIFAISTDLEKVNTTNPTIRPIKASLMPLQIYTGDCTVPGIITLYYISNTK